MSWLDAACRRQRQANSDDRKKQCRPCRTVGPAPWRRAPARLLVLLATLVVIVGCSNRDGSSYDHKPPAEVTKQPQETEIARITLSDMAEKRLGITLSGVMDRQVPRRRMLGGGLGTDTVLGSGVARCRACKFPQRG